MAETARATRVEPAARVLEVLAATGLQATVILRTPTERSDQDLAGHLTHPAHVVGSDGIFVGRCRHPRAYGTFARYLADHVRDRSDLTVAQLAAVVAARPARRFGIGTRAVLRRVPSPTRASSIWRP